MPKDLSRFLIAQETDYRTALYEIKSGRKRSHWMWYIFPQLKGLGSSDTARQFAIEDMNEAKAYLSHPVLGIRLREICHELLKIDHSDPYLIFGSPDDLKLKSCATLFLLAVESNESVFRKIIDKFFKGDLDSKTQDLLGE